MCIICIKPMDVEMPDIKTLNFMWQGNPDGAGFAYWRPGMVCVTINKGFMKLKALKVALTDMKFTKDDLVVLHFRWATHGLTDGGNCHPFPLSSKVDALRACQGHFPTAIAHNGVFGNMACHDTLSDTQKFIAKVMCNPIIARNLEEPSMRELLMGYCGSSSKLAVLRPGKCILIGEFEKDDKTGLVYSNDGYKPTKTYGYYNNVKPAGKDFPDEDPVDDGEYVTFPKVCELCAESSDIEYCDEYELFLCDKCYDWNVSQDVKHEEAIRQQEKEELLQSVIDKNPHIDALGDFCECRACYNKKMQVHLN